MTASTTHDYSKIRALDDRGRVLPKMIAVRYVDLIKALDQEAHQELFDAHTLGVEPGHWPAVYRAEIIEDYTRVLRRGFDRASAYAVANDARITNLEGLEALNVSYPGVTADSTRKMLDEIHHAFTAVAEMANGSTIKLDPYPLSNMTPEAWAEMPVWRQILMADYRDLTPALAGLEGEVVNCWPRQVGGSIRVFMVGRTEGWKPRHLELDPGTGAVIREADREYGSMISRGRPARSVIPMSSLETELLYGSDPSP